MEKDQKLIEEWEENKSFGRVKYALLMGSISGILLFLINGLMNFSTSSWTELFWSWNALNQFSISVIGSIIGYYTIMWSIMEHYYHKAKKRTEQLSKKSMNKDFHSKLKIPNTKRIYSKVEHSVKKPYQTDLQQDKLPSNKTLKS